MFFNERAIFSNKSQGTKTNRLKSDDYSESGFNK